MAKVVSHVISVSSPGAAISATPPVGVFIHKCHELPLEDIKNFPKSAQLELFSTLMCTSWLRMWNTGMGLV